MIPVLEKQLCYVVMKMEKINFIVIVSKSISKRVAHSAQRLASIAALRLKTASQ